MINRWQHRLNTGVLRLDVERRRRPARPPSLLAAVASTRTTPSPDLAVLVAPRATWMVLPGILNT
jgi:hypothetical protein